MTMPSSPGTEPQTALLLTDHEWDLLAEICSVFKATGVIPMVEHIELADRIIQANQ